MFMIGNKVKINNVDGTANERYESPNGDYILHVGDEGIVVSTDYKKERPILVRVTGVEHLLLFKENELEKLV